MAVNPATTADVEARWRPLTPEETALAGVFLEDAWRLLTAERPSIKTRMDDGTLEPELVAQVQAAMVRRVLMNPEGLREYSVDDFRAVRDQVLSAGLLDATPGELRLLGANLSRSRSVRMVAYGDA